MDRMIYLAMTGAKQIMAQQEATAHNLANVSTTGFRAQLSAFRAVPLLGPGAATRAYVLESTPGADFTPGTVQQTGRDLDLAVLGDGWIAVQLPDGSEGYTRNGGLQVSANGVLTTGSGQPVIGDGGPISVPPDSKLTIATDGTVSGLQAGQRATSITPLGRIKLVNPAPADLVRGDDGLFRLRGGGTADADAGVRVAPGALEGSNVNPVEAMVTMISLARQFEAQLKLLTSAEDNSRAASQVLGPVR